MVCRRFVAIIATLLCMVLVGCGALATSGSAEDVAPSAPSATKVKLGEMVETDGYEFQFKSLAWAEEIASPDGSVSSSVKAGAKYLVAYGTFKNLASDAQHLNAGTKATLLVNDKYSYPGQSKAAANGASSFESDVDPLQLSNLCIYFEVPNEAQEALESGTIMWEFEDDDENVVVAYELNFKKEDIAENAPPTISTSKQEDLDVIENRLVSKQWRAAVTNFTGTLLFYDYGDYEYKAYSVSKQLQPWTVYGWLPSMMSSHNGSWRVMSAEQREPEDRIELTTQDDVQEYYVGQLMIGEEKLDYFTFRAKRADGSEEMYYLFLGKPGDADPMGFYGFFDSDGNESSE